MSHVRQQIRDEVVDAVTLLNTTHRNVYRTRVYPMDGNSLPGICVYTKSESSQPATIGGLSTVKTYLRSMSVAIEVYAKASTDLDNDLDDIAVEIETAMANATDLAALAEDVVLSSTEIDIMGGDSEQPVGVMRMTYDIIYRTTLADPSAAL
jgi:ribosomal protein L3